MTWTVCAWYHTIRASLTFWTWEAALDYATALSQAGWTVTWLGPTGGRP